MLKWVAVLFVVALAVWSIVSYGISVGPYQAPAILGALLVASAALAFCARKFVFKKLR